MKASQLLRPLGAAIILVLLLTTGLSPSIWMLWEHIRYMQFEKEAQLTNLQTSVQAEKSIKVGSRQESQYMPLNQTVILTYQSISSNRTEYPLMASTPTFAISINAPSLVTASAILLAFAGTMIISLLNAFTSLMYKGITVSVQNPIIFTILGVGVMAFFAA